MAAAPVAAAAAAGQQEVVQAPEGVASRVGVVAGPDERQAAAETTMAWHINGHQALGAGMNPKTEDAAA